MTPDECNEVMDWLRDADIAHLNITDQLVIMSAFATLTETVRPIMLKDKEANKQSYIVRL